MSKLAVAARRSPTAALAVGETWFVKLPGSDALDRVLIEQLTEKTVCLELLGHRSARYARADVRFVERVRR